MSFARNDPCSRCTTAGDGPTWTGECPYARERVRPSPCADPTTEDNRTPIVVGMRLFNYYDGFWGIVATAPDETGWFYLADDNGRRTLLNGVRVATKEPPR